MLGGLMLDEGAVLHISFRELRIDVPIPEPQGGLDRRRPELGGRRIRAAEERRCHDAIPDPELSD